MAIFPELYVVFEFCKVHLEEDVVKFLILPLEHSSTASVVGEMATMQHKIFCIREFSESDSATAVQRAFRLKFNIQPPMRKSIYHWNKQFDETGSLYKVKSPGPSRVSEENVERIRVSFECSPMKSASRELGLSQTTVWRVLRRQLVYKPYHVKLVQALRANDEVKCVEFCDRVLKNMEDEFLALKLCFT